MCYYNWKRTSSVTALYAFVVTYTAVARSRKKVTRSRRLSTHICGFHTASEACITKRFCFVHTVGDAFDWGQSGKSNFWFNFIPPHLSFNRRVGLYFGFVIFLFFDRSKEGSLINDHKKCLQQQNVHLNFKWSYVCWKGAGEAFVKLWRL